jgi:hypothetical protein
MRENNARKISMGDMFTDFLVMHRQKQGIIIIIINSLFHVDNTSKYKLKLQNK